MSSTHLKGCLFHFGQILFQNLQGLGLSEEVRTWFRMCVGLAFLPVPRVVDGYDLVVTHTPDLPATFQFNEYFDKTWINGNFPLTIWNHFRSDIPRTNNNCEGYNSKLAKRAVKSHLNIYELILLFKSENANKEAHLLQLEGGQKPRKSRHIVEDKHKLFQLGLEYATCTRDTASSLSACGGVLSGTCRV